MTSPDKPIPVYFLLRKDILALDLVGPAEVLRYANRHREKNGEPPLFELRYVSAEPRIDTSIGLGLAGFGGGLGPVQAAAPANAAKPRSRSAIRSSTASSPMWKRTVGPPGALRTAVRMLVQSKGMARLS